ncbi:MAG: alkaline shock response membrane anchor protein AmaP [Alicyclobacillus sp.]|nr:alkaline shock response membrane anchor protein AmaP [Alicyclobacillus sp.]
MSILDRLLLIVLSIGALVASVLAILCETGGFNPVDVAASRRVSLTVCVIAVLYAMVAIRFLVYRLGGPRVDAIVLPGDHGQIRISFDTFRQLANRVGKSIRGVHEFDSRVASGSTGIWLAVRVKALPDYDLARMSSDIQQAVKTNIEHTTGVTVERVTVNVVELAAGSGKSARTWVE